MVTDKLGFFGSIEATGKKFVCINQNDNSFAYGLGKNLLLFSAKRSLEKKKIYIYIYIYIYIVKYYTLVLVHPP
jgi:hypothetical protein